MKNIAIYTLLAIGFIFLFVNPNEYSESWYTEMFLTKIVSAVAFGSVYLIRKIDSYIHGF